MADVDSYLSDTGQISSIYPDPEHAARLPWSAIAQDSVCLPSFHVSKGIEPLEQEFEPVPQAPQEGSDDGIFYPNSSSDDIAEYYSSTFRPCKQLVSDTDIVSTFSQKTNRTSLSV